MNYDTPSKKRKENQGTPVSTEIQQAYFCGKLVFSLNGADHSTIGSQHNAVTPNQPRTPQMQIVSRCK